ncbi:predicted protein [Naegleria gruberi]|uniref:Predicted protein n=1 Tax=Naegleria gruberi TaxID=5762 RepID=D2VB85_NAEGR|nr:uncharacterized protein NAEGRDRAFT_66127 [Naegleria gruberi]EFC45751.1 predicted protein [Naegleria gruberi]|eukprot:XP_002678495.1 predicted protein [Naegleria gruberi strain NEG-M]
MSQPSTFHPQLTDTVLMVRPVDFAFNEQTAVDNEFQNRIDDKTPNQIRDAAIEEFDKSVSALREAGVQVLVLEGSKKENVTKCPDAVFPNNWFSSSADGTVFTYPMFTPNRRAEVERLDDVLALLDEAKLKVKRIVKMHEEPSSKALEGTGCMVFDHLNGVVYANISERCNAEQLDAFVKSTEGSKTRAVTFKTKSSNGKGFYHTNVMLSIGEEFAIVCSAVIVEEDRERVMSELRKARKLVIDLTVEQTEKMMCANVIQLATKTGGKVIVMSDSAYNGFTQEQRTILEAEHGKAVVFPISKIIETIGGGSARCMIAEVFNPSLTQVQ